MIDLLSQYRKQHTTGKCRRAHGRRARTLAVESVEGRLMLSADWLEFVPSNIPAAQVSMSFESLGSIGSMPIQSIQVIGEYQGGFVSPSLSSGGVVLEGNLVSSGTGLSPSTLNDLLITRGTGATNDAAVMSDGWYSFGDFDSTFGPRLIVFELANQGPVLQPRLDQNFASSPRQHGMRNEGGAIPVESLLPGADPPAGDRRLLFAEKGDEAIDLARRGRQNGNDTVRPRQSAAAERPTPLNVTLEEHAPDLAPSHGAVISGEWARAMVFELAGGEPAESRPAPGDQTSRSSAGGIERESNTGRAGSFGSLFVESNESAVQRGDGNQSSAKATVIGKAELPATEAQGVVAVAFPVGPLNPFDRRRYQPSTATNAVSHVLTSLVKSHVVDTMSPSASYESHGELANAVVFMAIGTGEGTIISSLADEDAFAPTSAAPLVLVLALEQAAANSGRTKKHASVSAWPPRRLRGASNRK